MSPRKSEEDVMTSSNQKRTSNKFRPRNIFIPMIPKLYLYLIKTKKEQATNLR